MADGDLETKETGPPSRFTAVDRISVGFLGALFVASIACENVGISFAVLWIVGIIWALARLRAGGPRWLQLAHDFLPVAVIPVVFNLLAPVIPCVNPVLWDPSFAELDARFFQWISESWKQALGRPWWLTDFASVAYVSFYLLPVLLGVAALRRGQHEFETFAERIVFGFYVLYVAYAIFPTIGPRVPAELEDQILGGSAVSQAVRAFLHQVELTKTDAFPSGHTAITLICFAYAWRAASRYRTLWTLWTGAIVFSTVYLHYHYVVDTLAGVGLALLLGPMLSVCRRLSMHWRPRWLGLLRGVREQA